jgi:hypothetical protein
MNVTVSSCFEANVVRARRTEAVFQLNFINNATPGQVLFDGYTANITIPVGFMGVFSYCLNATVFGDDVIEQDEVIEYVVVPLSQQDSVQSTTYPFTISIFDNDGKLSSDGE